MKKNIGAKAPELHELPQIKERISFLYVEHCLINRQDSAISITDIRGTVNMPVASLSVLLLGPGTNITHRAMELIGDVGTSTLWIGERGVRYYAIGKPLTHSSALLIKQAELVSNKKQRLRVARAMYQMRFPGEDVSRLTMQQLRGREGARVRHIYRENSLQNDVEWDGRDYDPDNFDEASDINKALSAGNVCLYGLAHSVIVALGCSAGLGFVHTGHERSFVYDIADLYKAEFVIPLAFRLVSEGENTDIAGDMRRAMRDLIVEHRLLERMVRDIKYLLTGDCEIEIDYQDLVSLWDEKVGLVKNGISYGKNIEWEPGLGYGKIAGEKECSS